MTVKRCTCSDARSFHNCLLLYEEPATNHSKSALFENGISTLQLPEFTMAIARRAKITIQITQAVNSSCAPPEGKRRSISDVIC